MKATLKLAQAIRRSITDQIEQDQCINSENLDERILGALVLAEQKSHREVVTDYNSPQLTDDQLLRYLELLAPERYEQLP